jgi:hypothetical protein
MGNVDLYEPQLRRLRGHFVRGGIVHMSHCHAGANRPLMTAFARIFGVPVVAGRGCDLPGLNLSAFYLRANPDGTYQRQFWRPE